MRSTLVLHLLTLLIIPCTSSRKISMDIDHNSDPTIKIPIKSVGAAPSTLHLVPIKLGEPPQTLHLIPDTGSDATWVFCDESSSNYHTFHHTLSSTFTPIHCSSPSCSATDGCSSPSDPCTYAYEYADGSSTTGHWATDTMTVMSDDGLELKINGVMIGCSDRQSSNFTDADGILGLSPTSPSFTSQVAGKLGIMRFSYVLANGDHFVFGRSKRADFRREKMQFVKLVGGDAPFFYVELSRMSIDGEILDIPKEVWRLDRQNQTGGVILDTGTTMTYVPHAAFRVIRSSFLRIFRESDSVKMTNSEICFALDASEVVDGFEFPRISIEFDGGVQLEPSIENMYYKDDKGMDCLAISPVDQSEGSIIGSSLQKGYFWEYDLLNQRVGFAPLR